MMDKIKKMEEAKEKEAKTEKKGEAKPEHDEL